MTNPGFASQSKMPKNFNVPKNKVKKNILKNRMAHHSLFLLLSAFFLHPFSIGFLSVKYANGILTMPHTGRGSLGDSSGLDTFTYDDRLFFIALLFVVFEIIPFFFIAKAKLKARKPFDWARVISQQETGKSFYITGQGKNKGDIWPIPIPQYCFNVILAKSLDDSATLLANLFSSTGELKDSLWNNTLDDKRNYSFTLSTDPDGQVREYGVLVHILLEKTDADSTHARIVCSPIYKNPEGSVSSQNASKVSSSEFLSATQGWVRLISNELGVDKTLVADTIPSDPTSASVASDLATEYREGGGAKGLAKTAGKALVIVLGGMLVVGGLIGVLVSYYANH